jgi:hypothetical protein
MNVLLIIAVVVLIGVGVYVSMQLAAARRKELTEWGAGRGLSFSPARDGSVESRFPGFSCLRNGRNRYAYNFLAGQWSGRDYLSFDYHYETHSTDSQGHAQTQTHRFSAVVLSSPVPLKSLVIRPEHMFDKLAGFFGLDDINFESAEFSRKFYVKSPDKKWAYDVIHQRTMEFLLGMPRFSLEMDGHSVIAWRHSTFKTQDFEQAAELVRGILDRLPEYLVKQQMSQP